jgi:hypothetical protein
MFYKIINDIVGVRLGDNLKDENGYVREKN